MRYTSGYLYKPFVPELREKVLNSCVDQLNQLSLAFDAIAFSGMSGALIAPTLADLLGKELILVRKPSDNSHSYDTVQGFRDGVSYIVVDDFISTGKTVKYIIDTIANNGDFKHYSCKAIFCYARDQENSGAKRIANDMRLPLYGVYL